ncbi:polymorphic toxin-type HINT domain-containing protein, partial [Kitasatospora sp. MY 5-36]|uniref:polymorphic toxin-type HINT domain-containing protein n=2 Tax=Kitasatospora sp. MY 5-36 TaxID=1678027 RepID=UPI00067088D4
LEAERKEAEKQAQAEKQKQDSIAALEEEIKKAKEDSDNVSYLYHLFSESVHLTLDVIGGAGGVIAPGLADVADLINCAYYAVEGRTADALTSCIGAIPFIGDGAAVAKLAQWAKKFGSWGEKAVEFIQKLVNRLPPSCPRLRMNSFPAGTHVLMADGSTRRIETVKAGDKVLATDPTTGVTGPRRVSAAIYTPDDRGFTDISLGSGKSLTSTDHHPFWSESQKQWIDAVDLRVGDELRDPAGRPQRIEAVRHRSTLQPAYNLTVDDLHTYYVLAGGVPVLVHNDNAWQVPDDFVIIRGGQSPMPDSGVEFSGSMGSSVNEAGAGVPHGSLRATTAGAIRAAGGTVVYAPEPIAGAGSPLNYNHVNVTLGSSDPFGAIESNPVPKAGRLAPDALGVPRC